MTNVFLPPVNIAAGMKPAEIAAANALKPMVDAAVAELKGWWPCARGQEKSQVVIGPGKSVDSKTRALDMTKGEARPWMVGVGIELLQHGVGAKLIANSNWTAQEAVKFVLAHETWHLSEPARMTACGVNADQRSSPFARGIDPAMNDGWKESIHILSEAYPFMGGLPPTTKKAAEIVTELSADIRALNFARAKGVRWPAAKGDLLAIRVADLVTDPSGAYDYVDELTELNAKQNFPTEREALPFLWGHALKALSSISHGRPVDEAIKQASSALTIKEEGASRRLFNGG